MMIALADLALFTTTPEAAGPEKEAPVHEARNPHATELYARQTAAIAVVCVGFSANSHV